MCASCVASCVRLALRFVCVLRCVLRLRLRCVFFRRRFLRYAMRFMRDTGYLRFAFCVLRALFVLLLRLDAVVGLYFVFFFSALQLSIDLHRPYIISRSTAYFNDL